MQKKEKKKRYTLVYSRKTHDDGKPVVTYIFGRHPFDILAARCINEIEKAKQRVQITAEGKYKYDPSIEYKKFFKNFLKQKRRIQNNPPSILKDKKEHENHEHSRQNDPSKNRPSH